MSCSVFAFSTLGIHGCSILYSVWLEGRCSQRQTSENNCSCCKLLSNGSGCAVQQICKVFILFVKGVVWGLLCHHRSEKKRVLWIRNVITDVKWHALCSWLQHHYTKMIRYQHGGNKKRVVICREMAEMFITVFLCEAFKEAVANYINNRLHGTSLT